MKNLGAIVISLFLISCGATVAVDYDQKTDFNMYKTYSFYPSIESGLSELDDARIETIADSLFREKGYINSENPQLYINFYVRENISNSRNTIGVGLGSSGGNVGVGISGGIPIGGRIINQQFTLDLIDVQRDELVWQGVAEGELKEKATPDQKEVYYQKILAKIINKFPPN